MVADNAARRTRSPGWSANSQRIQQQRFIVQQARGYGLGGPKEIAFTLGAERPKPPARCTRVRPACGSARGTSTTPLDSWLTLLFGPGD